MVIILLMMAGFTNYADSFSDKKVVLITVNEVTFEDLYEMPTVRQWIENGAIALMNNRTSTTANMLKAYTTIGAGVRAEASADSIQSSNLTEESQKIYRRRTGIEIGSSGIVNLDMPRLQRLNLSGEYGAVPGALGQALRNKGLKTAAIGNGDTEETFARFAPLVAMDENGFVDYGDVSQEILEHDDFYPFGVKNNYAKMAEVFRECYEKASLTVIDFADIHRLERYRNNMSDTAYLNHKAHILAEFDDYLAKISNLIDFDNTRLLLVTPYPSSANIRIGNRLTPLVLVGDGISPGVMTSDTTRREGIVGNVDIAPTIAVYLGAEGENMTGRVLKVIERQENLSYLLDLNQRVIATSQFRYPVLTTFAIFEIFISIIALLIILFKDRLKHQWVHYFTNLLLSTMAIPFVLLILSFFAKRSLFFVYLWIVLITILITYLVTKISSHRLDNLLILSGITTIGLLVDIITNGNLIKHSLLGYDPIIGARYYGIGNEYMGVLIGSTLVFATILLDRYPCRRHWALLIFLITILIVGFPGLGANVGGTITAVVAFVFASLRLYNIKIRLKQLFFIGISAVIVVGLMAYLDIHLLGSKSHLAGAIDQIFSEGIGTIPMIINRKLSMNLRLIRVTIWSKVLISTIVILAILFYRPVGVLNRLFRAYPNLSIGWGGIVAACVIGFLVNDSGVVASATGIIFLGMSMLYLTFYIPKEG